MVVPGVPHHVTQRGNRRQRTFFRESDYETYKHLMAEWCRARGVVIWAYCLMPNHVHLVLVPPSADALRGAVGEAHRRYTLMVNHREGWCGCLWQGRFASFPMDSGHLYHCVRYVELNPVRAGLTRRPEDWNHSSARARLLGGTDPLAGSGSPLPGVDDWGAFLSAGLPEERADELRRHERTGRPLGDERFIEALESALGRRLRRQAPGPRPRSRVADAA